MNHRGEATRIPEPGSGAGAPARKRTKCVSGVQGAKPLGNFGFFEPVITSKQQRIFSEPHCKTPNADGISWYLWDRRINSILMFFVVKPIRNIHCNGERYSETVICDEIPQTTNTDSVGFHLTLQIVLQKLGDPRGPSDTSILL